MTKSAKMQNFYTTQNKSCPQKYSTLQFFFNHHINPFELYLVFSIQYKHFLEILGHAHVAPDGNKSYTKLLVVLQKIGYRRCFSVLWQATASIKLCTLSVIHHLVALRNLFCLMRKVGLDKADV